MGGGREEREQTASFDTAPSGRWFDAVKVDGFP